MNMEVKTAHLLDELQTWRQDFHAHPELGFEEQRTSDRVAELLESFGITVHRGIGKTGLVGVLKKGTGSRTVGLRADMDALPISEKNEFEYKSCNHGVMHACGHDGHTTMLLGAAKHLAEKGDFDGTVVFIFQPAEEHGHGSAAMISDGLFEKFAPQDVYGIHNIPGMELGSFATCAGPITASEALFEIDVTAKGGHAALPHTGVDAIMVGSQIVNALQTIVSRKLDPSLNGVVSVTEFIADGGRNVLPGNVLLKGDCRALRPAINATIEASMREIVQGVCMAHGVTATVSYETIFPATINSLEPALAAAQAARTVVGSENVDGDCQPKSFSEDFAHMAAVKPGCFILMGNGTEGAHAMPLHSTEYDFNNAALTIGSSFWVELVEQELTTN
jgi:amidohydrolase